MERSCEPMDKNRTVKRAVAAEAKVAFKKRIREITRRTGGRSLSTVAAELRGYMPGWKAYFHLAQTPKVFRLLDSWLRHRLRALQLRTGVAAPRSIGSCARWAPQVIPQRVLLALAGAGGTPAVSGFTT